MRIISRFNLPSLNYLTDLLSAFTIPPDFRLKLLLITIHGLLLIWACVNAFTHLGCFDSPLLCPQSRFQIPFTQLGFPIPTEVPLPLLIILISTLNVTHIAYSDRLFKINYYLCAACIGLFLLSFIFIETTVRYQDAILEELQKMGFQ